MKKYAFLLMGGHYDPAVHQCRFETDRDVVILRTVRTMEEAETVAKELWQDGVGAIELCGAFGPENADRLTEATGNQVAIGYVVHNPRLDPLFTAFFQ
ncbi:MAG: DUF6506 family protein [Planctomycetaceae bacterium]|nr:DUF6506 family protein [Planctomycetaceae bacterium]